MKQKTDTESKDCDKQVHSPEKAKVQGQKRAKEEDGTKSEKRTKVTRVNRKVFEDSAPNLPRNKSRPGFGPAKKKSDRYFNSIYNENGLKQDDDAEKKVKLLQ